MRHIWSVLCTKATVDRESNNVSLLEVLEQIHFEVEAQQGPEWPEVLPFSCELVTLWARSDPDKAETGSMRVRLLGPNGAELASWEGPVDLRNNIRNRVRGKYEGIRIEGNGRHEFEVSFRDAEQTDWRVVTSLPIDITVTTKEPEPADHPAEART